MKNLYKIFKTQLAVAVVLLSASFGFAQTLPVVKVPQGCLVVVAGSGGTLGTDPTTNPGTVGDGGVVAMPDPFPSATFPAFTFFYVANGTTIQGASVKGDLSFGTSTISGTPVTSDVGITASKIQSYNKFLRPSENLAPSQAIWGRSKGLVNLKFVNSCGKNSINFEVYKVYVPTVPVASLSPTNQPNNVPRIVGPTCLLPNRQYTYSVDQVASDNANDSIGFDSYYWSGIPTGLLAGSLYFSADYSSVTFTTGGGIVVPTTLKCCFGRVNPLWDGGVSNSSSTGFASHGICVDVPLVPAPVAFAFTATTLTTTAPLFSTSFTGCLPTGQTSFSVTYGYPPAGTNYTWSVLNTGWSISNNNNATITTTFSGIDNNPGQIKLTVSNGNCAPTDFFYQINRSFVAPATVGAPGLVISPANTCILAGSTTNFSINGLGNGTIWTLTPALSGSQINASTVGSSMSLVLPSTASGQYTLTATGVTSGLYPTCGGSISTKINIKPAAPTIPSGTTCVVRNGGAAQTYTCGAVAGATGYAWTFPAGWSASIVTTTLPTVTITPNGTSNSGAISVVALGVTGSGCNSDSSPSLTINYSVVTPSISEKPSCYNVNMSSLVTVNVSNAPSPFFGTYSVTLTPAGATTTPASLPNYAVASSVAFNTSLNTITFNTEDTLANILLGTPTIISPPSGNYDLWITFNTQTTGGTCTQTASVKIQITISPANAATLFTNYAPALNGGDNYITSGAPTGSTYVWRAANISISGANNSTLLLAGNGVFSGQNFS